MTDARAKLYDAVLYWTSAGYKMSDNPEEANELIDAFAHELAEKIRQEYGDKCENRVWTYGPDDAADLIDPEVNDE